MRAANASGSSSPRCRWPSFGLPQLDVIARADYHHFFVEAREVAQGRRQDHSALGVELDLERAREDEARKDAGSSVG